MTLDEIEKLIQAVTEGPWEAKEQPADKYCSSGLLFVRSIDAYGSAGLDICSMDTDLDAPMTRPNAAFIASMRSLAPLMLAVCRATQHAAAIGYFCAGGSTDKWVTETLAALESADVG